MYSSPIQTAALTPICTNENGKIYGSEYFLNTNGIEPDLILAEGISGIEGYVKSEDINKYADSLEEAMNFDSSTYTIPVYNVDGETIIDYFIVVESTEK